MGLNYVRTIFFIAFSILSVAVSAQSREEGGSQSEPSKTRVKLFPNPAVEFLHVTFEEPIAKQSKLTVHNIIGNVLEVESETIDEHEVRLRVKDLPVGYYLLAIRDERSNARSTLKFLKR